MEFDATTIRLFLHLVAVAVWVGGQIVLLGLLPTVRALGDDAPKRIARQFNRIAWPAYAVAVLTGVWNLTEVMVGDRSTGYQTALFIKLVLVAASGVGAWFHSRATSPAQLAVGGAVGFVGALGAVLFAVIMVGS